MKNTKSISTLVLALLALFSLSLSQAAESSEVNPLCKCENCTCKDCTCDGAACKCENCGKNCTCKDCTCKDCQCKGGECKCENCPDKVATSTEAKTEPVAAKCGKCGTKEVTKTAPVVESPAVVKN